MLMLTSISMMCDDFKLGFGGYNLSEKETENIGKLFDLVDIENSLIDFRNVYIEKSKSSNSFGISLLGNPEVEIKIHFKTKSFISFDDLKCLIIGRIH